MSKYEGFVNYQGVGILSILDFLFCKAGKRRAAFTFLFGAAFALAFAALTPVNALAFVSYGEYQTVINKVSTPVIYGNIFINGIDVSNLSKADALSKLNAEIGDKLLANTVTVVAGEHYTALTFKQLGASYDFQQPVEDAFNYARTGNIYQRFVQIMALKDSPYNIHAQILPKIDRAAAAAALSPFAEKINVAPVDAKLGFADGGLVVTNEVVGSSMDIGKTLDAITQKMPMGQSCVVNAVVAAANPKVTAAELKKSKDVLGEFTTNFSTGSNQAGRNKNLETASKKINGTVMMPGDVFSCNAALGEMTAANGYYMASVIENGKLTEGMGGGVCQVSTTLYNAVLKAELTVLERTNHSMKVGYIDYSFDSTLASDYLDLKFKNSTDAPIYLYVQYDPKGHFTARIYGHETRPAGRTISFASKLLKRTPAPAPKVTEDPSLAPGARVVDQAGRDGLTYELVKTVYIDGKPTDSVVVNKSYYKSSQEVERVGPPGKAAPTVPDQTPANPADNQTPPASGTPAEPNTPGIPSPGTPPSTPTALP